LSHVIGHFQGRGQTSRLRSVSTRSLTSPYQPYQHHRNELTICLKPRCSKTSAALT
jgi:hypothetical protein